MFSSIWALGGTLDGKSRDKFTIMFRGLLEKTFPEEILELFGYEEEIPPPAKQYIMITPPGGSIFDYRYIKEVIMNILMWWCCYSKFIFSGKR